jgi:hypothetical protein
MSDGRNFERLPQPIKACSIQVRSLAGEYGVATVEPQEALIG